MRREARWWWPVSGRCVLGLLFGCLAGCGAGSPEDQPAVAAPESSGLQMAEISGGLPPPEPTAGTKPALPDTSGSEPLPTADAATNGKRGSPARATSSQWRAWATALAGGDVTAKEAASDSLDRAAAADPQPLWAMLEDASPEVRRGAIFYWLDRFDPADAEAVTALSRRLTDPDPAVRAIAMSAARRFPVEALMRALPQLSLVLADREGNAETRAAAARLIGSLDAQGREAAPALMEAAGGDPEPSVRSACLLSLCRAADADQAVAALQQALQQDAQASIRGLAAVRLGKLGPPAAAAAPALATALADRDETVGRKAADALAELGPAAVTPAVGKLDAADVRVRRLAVFVLAKLGADAKPALEALRHRLADPDDQVKQLAERAIRRIQGAGQ